MEFACHFSCAWLPVAFVHPPAVEAFQNVFVFPFHIPPHERFVLNFRTVVAFGFVYSSL